MTDSSWDNQGATPERKGWPTWLKVMLGCGLGCVLLVILVTGTCVGAGVWISKNPDRFEKYVKDKVQDFARDDWNLLRRSVDQLRTPEGTKTLYEANPELKEQFPDLAAFERQVAEWRPRLAPVPEAIPDLDSKGFEYNSNPGRTRIGFRQADGSRIRMDVKKGTLVRIQVLPPKQGSRISGADPETPTPPAPPSKP